MKQAAAIAYRSAREGGDEEASPVRASTRKRSVTETRTERFLTLAVRKGDLANAERLAKDLAGLRGDPAGWQRVLDETRKRPAMRAATTARALGTLPPPKARARTSETGIVGFYDRNPKLVLGTVFAGSVVGGVQLNLRLGPLTPFQVQPSTFAGLGALGLVLLARHKGWRRTSKIALAVSLGQGAASLAAHLPPEGGMLRPSGPKA